MSEIKDLYNLETLREMTHRVALERPDGDEFCIRVIAMIQLCEAQQESIRRHTRRERLAKDD